jgi:hypothetical protein
VVEHDRVSTATLEMAKRIAAHSKHIVLDGKAFVDKQVSMNREDAYKFVVIILFIYFIV